MIIILLNSWLIWEKIISFFRWSGIFAPTSGVNLLLSVLIRNFWPLKRIGWKLSYGLSFFALEDCWFIRFLVEILVCRCICSIFTRSRCLLLIVLPSLSLFLFQPSLKPKIHATTYPVYRYLGKKKKIATRQLPTIFNCLIFIQIIELIYLMKIKLIKKKQRQQQQQKHY